MNMRYRPTSQRSQTGVGLIEVLVAVLILSIGVLGMAALQAMSLSTNNSAAMRSMATIASYSIIDAMRADLGNAKNGDYNTASPMKATACGTATSGNLASAQRTHWCQQLGKDLGKLASTTGSINCLDTGECTVTITYDDSRAGKLTPASSSSSGGNSQVQTVVTKGIL